MAFEASPGSRWPALGRTDTSTVSMEFCRNSESVVDRLGVKYAQSGDLTGSDNAIEDVVSSGKCCARLSSWAR